MTEATTIDLSDITPLAAFITECEQQGLATRSQLRWMSRWRAENGLLASGAIIERRINPGAKKGMLFVVRPKFVQWLSSQTEVAA